MFNKKGVSLVTVLLFMLIATIAGTATYKWLSSAQGSSASRMNIAEAQQASRAGLDAVRAWMTFHANDVGAVMHQYINGGNKPVRLDAVVKAFGSHKQDYSVWLTGVDASTSPYRLKITSVGTARGGAATYSENSILRVNGLYRVRIPEKHLGINFDGAFAGQHAGITGSDSLESGLITGDFEANNIPKIYSKMVITGKAKYGGDIEHLGDVYIGKGIETTGKITFGNATTIDTLVGYVGGPVKCASGQPFTVYGDLYLNGPIEDCILDVKGNLTVNANLQVAFSNNNYKITVGKNMVFTENGKMDFKKQGAAEGGGFNRYTTITVGGNLYLPDKIEAHCDNGVNGPCGDTDKDRKITVTGAVYRYNVTHYYRILQQNSAGSEYGIYMQSTDQNTVYTNDDYNKGRRITSISAASYESQTVVKWDRTDNVLKNVSGQYWTKIDKINAYGNLIVDNAIPQPILVDHETDWKAKVANGLCTGIADNGSFDMDDNAVDALNTCYETLNSSQLYNGFLIIKWNYTQNKQPTHTLNHKFVLYATEKLGGDPYLPATSDDGMVLLYLEHGAGQLNARGEHNYVIYSKENIEEINGLKLTGTMILEPGARLVKTQGETRLQFGRTVVNTMAEAGLIKENPAYTAVANPDGTGGAYSAGAGALDAYYVATAPQLNISLESQYKNKEIDPASLSETKRTDIQPSVIVMPRVIYVPQNLVGKLSDYYSVLNLNKAADKGNASVSCNPGGLSTTIKYDGKTLVPDDIYTCRYESTYGDNPFYVVVNGTKGKVPAVTFETPNWTQITAGGSPATVNMLVKQATGSATMTVGVNVYNLPDSWSLVPQDGVSAQGVSSGVDGMRAYIVTFKANEAKKPLFKLSAPTNAEAATVHFELAEPLSGCTVGTPSSYDVSISGSATINRDPIPASFCDAEGHATLTASNNDVYNCSDVTSSDWPSCNDKMQKGIWVYPYCNSLTTITDNTSWTCGTNYAIRLLKYNISNQCLAFIPDTSLEADNDETYTLYASLKRKPYKLYVKAVGASVNPEISIKDADADDNQYTVISSSTTEGGYKVYQVYSNYKVKAEVKNYGSNRFNYWGCAGADCNDHEVDDNPVAEYLISGVDTLTAHFNERDEHCFYDSFGNMKNSKGTKEDFEIFCPKNNTTYENCIDRCKSEYHCSVGVAGQTYQGYDPAANWMLVYTNHKSWSTSYNDFEEPDYLLGFIRAPGAFLNIASALGVYRATMLLHRVKAGTDGKFSLKMRVPTDATETFEDLIGKGKNYDDGAVLRSDAAGNSYLTVNLYKGSILDSQHRPGAMLRVCYVKGLENEGKDCIEKPLVNMFNGDYVPLKSLTDVTMNLTLDGATLKVDLDYNTALINNGSHDLGSVTFDLSQLKNTSLSYGADGHEYIGMKMFNRFYHYKDISWASETYSNKCFDTPRIYCSFANQYLGGTVPKDENVTPWVGISSWFSNNSSCEAIEYYYNGCDMSSSLYAKNFKYLTNSLDCYRDAIGGFWDKGAKLYGSTYNFEDQGYHKIDTSKTLFGDYKLSGYAKNASVEITCGSTTYSTDCGQFYVGDIVPCTKHERSFDQDKYCSEDPCFVNMPDGEYANLREAKLSMTISNLSESINAYLIDQNGVASDPYPISQDGTIEFYTSQVSNKLGFDPQTVSAVKFVGSTGFTVSGLQSYCSNAPGVFDCTASFDGNGFMINSTITNTINAANGGCTVSNNEKILSDMTQDCPANGSFYVPGSDVYEGLNSGNAESQDYTFTITMTDKENVQTTCQTNVVNVKKTSMSCWVEASEIDAGENLPAFRYYMQNCPTGGCDATVELVGKVDEQSVTYNKNCTESVSCEAQSWTPADINTAAGTLTYRLKYSTLPVCEATVTVNAVTPASASNCRVEEGVFKANITAPSSGAAKAKLWYGDLIGNVIGSERTISEYTEFTQAVDLPNGSYTLVLTLNGESACTVPYTVGSGGTGGSSSSGGGSNSGNSSAGNQNEVSCSITSATVNAVATSTGPSMAIPASSVTVSGCGANECTYTVKDGSSIVGGPTTYNSGYNLYFTGATAPGKHDYTVSIKHGEDDAVNCTGTYTVNYAAASSGGVSTTGSIGCTFSKLTLDLGQSFTLTPSYGGSCWTSALTGSGTSGAAGCANRYEITPLAIGTQRYTYTVTSGDKGEASCVADVTVNDVVVTGSVEISSKGVDTEVPCRKTIVVSTTTDENNGTGLYCSGSFDKTVGSSTAGQYNVTSVHVCDSHGYGNTPTSCRGTFATECLPGKKMSCKVTSP